MESTFVNLLFIIVGMLFPIAITMGYKIGFNRGEFYENLKHKGWYFKLTPKNLKQYICHHTSYSIEDIKWKKVFICENCKLTQEIIHTLVIDEPTKKNPVDPNFINGLVKRANSYSDKA